MSQVRGDDNSRPNVPTSGKKGQMAATSSLALFGDTLSRFAREVSAPIPYDQLSGFHLGLVMVTVLTVWERVGRGERHAPVTKENHNNLFIVINLENVFLLLIW